MHRIAVLLVLFNLLLQSPAKASDTEAILLVTFGTSMEEAMPAFDTIDRMAKERFPDTPIRWAYTSEMIRAIMAERGETWLSPEEALLSMAGEEYSRIMVQSLHVIPGEEFHGLVQTIHKLKMGPLAQVDIKLGAPLLNTSHDLIYTTQVLFDILPIERTPEQAVVFMGHGTHHGGDVYYAALQYHLWNSDPLAFMGTVEGVPALDDIIPSLKEQGATQVWLVPFMSVAGDHARNDMAGAEPDSWKSTLEAQGFEVFVILKGMGEYPAMASLWLDHLEQAIAGTGH